MSVIILLISRISSLQKIISSVRYPWREYACIFSEADHIFICTFATLFSEVVPGYRIQASSDPSTRVRHIFSMSFALAQKSSRVVNQQRAASKPRNVVAAAQRPAATEKKQPSTLARIGGASFGAAAAALLMVTSIVLRAGRPGAQATPSS